jgi:hypothetical protein
MKVDLLKRIHAELAAGLYGKMTKSAVVEALRIKYRKDYVQDDVRETVYNLDRAFALRGQYKV